VVESLSEVLMLAVAELKLEFTRRGEADFTEIAQGASRALGTPESPTIWPCISITASATCWWTNSRILR